MNNSSNTRCDKDTLLCYGFGFEIIALIASFAKAIVLLKYSFKCSKYILSDGIISCVLACITFLVTGINRVSKIKHYKRTEFIILKFFVLIEIFVCFSLYVFITKESLGYTFTIIVFILSIPPLIPELIHVHRRKMKHLIEKLKEDNQIESGLHTISLG